MFNRKFFMVKCFTKSLLLCINFVAQILTQRRWHKFPSKCDNCDIELTDIKVKL